MKRTNGDTLLTEQDYREFFKEYVDAEASNQIAHEDVCAWGAPGECHGLVERGHERYLEKMEHMYGVTIREMLLHLGMTKHVDRIIRRLHDERCPFCKG